MPLEPRLPVRPFVVDALRESGHVVSGSAPLHVEGPATDVVVDELDGTLAVWGVEGESVRGIHLVTRDAHVVERFLLMTVAGAWRRRHGRRSLPDRRLRRPRSHRTLLQDDGTSAVVDAAGTVVAWRLTRADAHRLAVALGHPVEDVVAALREEKGRPVWTGSTLAPVVRSLVLAVVPLVVVATVQVRRHAGSWETNLGVTLGLVLSIGGIAWYAWRRRQLREASARRLDRERLGAARWRATQGAGFVEELARRRVRTRLPRLMGAGLTLVETVTALEVWLDGRGTPLLEVPWVDVVSVDAERAPGSDVGVLVVRTRDGGRVPVVPARVRTGSERGASAAATAAYAAHLRAEHLGGA
ncbi:hypothetical protein Cfla_0275 [Cellulomonas flavigena DSM 20109]|uniref:Uncharacterized protein n=1 Tax=Cellulomonas flavigena (strain ATCC 482 / DSM 20109 / BCRC 11376 / JCM 18109 / NBRC 3775 / NCIMB 8073 / NRS 134) TaxID=446466 RepID=D5UGZ1_CELFN|nr:hypothetical protein [Cellulomonas flavigena]ADG73194.1 hypothetical protein Cfla_0275 [Cellulomonas flavigena DSM 20109]